MTSSQNVKSPSMRRPVGVKWVSSCFRSARFSLSSRVATVATLPSALFVERFCALGASWVFSFQPVLPPDFRPPVPLFRNGSWARRLTQSPELGDWAFIFPSSEMFCLYAAAGIAVPRVVQHASRERPAVHRHLWPKVVLTSVIGYKVSRYSVARARPEPLATAKVVRGLIPKQSIPSRQYAALNYELSVPRRVTSAIANGTAAP